MSTTIVSTVQETGPGASGRVDVPGGDSDYRGLVQWTWFTVSDDETPGSCMCDRKDDGDP